jgi:hypothetical protein
MDSLLKDLRFAARMLVKQPALAFIAIVTFALGIGFTATVFSIVNGALYRGLPFEQSTGLLGCVATTPDFLDRKARQSAFKNLAAMAFSPVNIALGEGRPERFEGASFTSEMLDVLNVEPVLGRAFGPGRADRVLSPS